MNDQQVLLELDVLHKKIVDYSSCNPNSQVAFALQTIEEIRKDHTSMDNSTILENIHREVSKEAATSGSAGKKSKIEMKATDSTPKRKRFTTTICSILRICFLELPLVVVFALALVTSNLSYWYDTYLEPQIDQMKYTDENRTEDLTYFHRHCLPDVISTQDPSELMIQEDFTTDDCVEHMMIHGMSMYKNILDDETADSLRLWILERNKSLKKLEEISVISNQNRWSFYIGVNDHPSVTKALNQIVNHKQFRPALEKIVGKNPAVIELTAITSAYGAEDQFWHPDIVSSGSPAKYVRSFVPSYSLFITLQDTTAAMGATEVCPGTYMCSNSDASETCENVGFQVSGDDKWNKGDAIFMNQQSFHRGAAHNDPVGPHRALFILSFSHKPLDIYESRMLGQGGSYSLKWDMWGHTLEDLAFPKRMRQPWAALRGLGIYNRKGRSWGWDWISNHMMRLANGDTGYDHETFVSWAKGGGLGLPKILTLEMTPRMTVREYYRETVRLWSTVAKAMALVVYISAIILICVRILLALALSEHSIRNLSKSSIKLLIRVALVNSLLTLLALKIVDHGSNTPWATAIRSKMLYPPPFIPVEDESLIPSRPLVAVTEKDILITDRFDQSWLASMAMAPEYHEGNRIFRRLIENIVPLYKILNGDGKRMIATSIVKHLRKEGSQQVLQDELGNWVLLTESESLRHVQQSLHLKSSPAAVSFARQQLLFLISDYKHGWRHTGLMARKYSVIYLNSLMNRILENSSVPVFSPYHVPELTKTTYSSQFTKDRKIPSFLMRSSNITSSLPQKSVLKFRSAEWDVSHESTEVKSFKIGDMVEAKYNGLYNEYYKGKIVDIRQGSFIDVEYTDGEIDTNLFYHHVHEFIPYSIGENIFAKMNIQDTFFPGRIVDIHTEDDTVSVEFYEDGIVRKTPHSFLRRQYYEFDLGDYVEAPFGAEEERFRGVIVARNHDGAGYTIQFDDGDIVHDVPSSILEHVNIMDL